MKIPAKEALFGTFPRAFGNPHQWVVHSADEFDLAIEECDGERNIYASISQLTVNGQTVTDRVFYDFDSAEKDAAFPHVDRDDEKIAKMRDDPGLAKQVLGDVVRDASALARKSRELSIPCVGVFSGFGIHLHQFYQPEFEPKRELRTTALMFRDRTELETMDVVPVGDLQRLSRVPNCERVHDTDERDPSAPKVGCDLYTIPLSHRELETLTVEDVLKASRSRRVDMHVDLPPVDERPKMAVFAEYLSSDEGGSYEQSELDVDISEVTDDLLFQQLRDLVQMPCVYERAMQRNPKHDVRRNFAVMLFNIGFTPDDVMGVIQRLNWIDFDASYTREQLEQIYDRGYSDMSCSTMMSRGLCTRHDDPQSCETYGWSGGQCEWKDER